MNTNCAQWLTVALIGCLINVSGFAATAARAPSKTPLGRLPSEVLASKVVVSNMQKSFDFYTQVIGLKPAKSVNQLEPIPPAGPDNSQWPVEYGFNFSGSFAEAFFDILRPRPDSLPTPASASLTWLVFKVPDAPAVIRRAKELGYTVTREAPTVGPGEMAIGMLNDPDGYHVEVIQAGSYPADGSSAVAVASAPTTKPMTLLGVSVPCSDFERCLGFYSKGMGMSSAQGAGPSEMVVMFPGGGTTILLQKPRDGASPLPARTGLSRLTVLVPDLKALVDRLAAAGFPLPGRVVAMPQYHVSVAQLQDPDGNSIELVQRGP